MFTLSINEALKIQHAQIMFYRQRIGRSGIKFIRENTTLPPEIGNPDDPLPVSYINQLIPRGGDFENLPQKYPVSYDNNSISVHDAIRSDKPF